MANNRIKKIKLSNGTIYSIFDDGALRLNDAGILITGNAVVDQVILQGGLTIAEVDDVDVNKLEYTKVLVQDSTTGKVVGKDKNKLLEDIGGISYSMDESDGVLSFKFGAQ